MHESQISLHFLKEQRVIFISRVTLDWTFQNWMDRVNISYHSHQKFIFFDEIFYNFPKNLIWAVVHLLLNFGDKFVKVDSLLDYLSLKHVSLIQLLVFDFLYCNLCLFFQVGLADQKLVLFLFMNHQRFVLAVFFVLREKRVRFLRIDNRFLWWLFFMYNVKIVECRN